MKALIISPGQDTAGCGNALKRAFDAESDWTVRQVVRQPSSFGYPHDIFWDATTDRMVRRFAAEADVLHVMEAPQIVTRFANWDHKKIVVHHLGTRYRRDPAGGSALCQSLGATEVVDMHELLYLPHLRWLPTPQDLPGMAAIRDEHFVASKRIRIAHAPTSREIKSTELVIATVEALALVYPIAFDLIEGVPNAECLRRKANADLVIDALSLGYAVNAVESWAMGIPIICGLEPVALRNPPSDMRERMLADFGEMPFVEATSTTLARVIEELITTPGLLREWGERGKAHAWKFHSPKAVVERTIAVYSS